jgi:hypothetical protein
MAVRICEAEGEANIVPDIEPVRRPCPTSDVKEGSWPAPPPDRRDTFFFDGVER